MRLTEPLLVYLPSTRGVKISQWGLGNLKIGPGVFTYDRMPGLPTDPALGSDPSHPDTYYGAGTCPGATTECRAICYAARPVAEAGAVADMWHKNSLTPEVPEIPERCTLLRIHISGDFDTNVYIHNWIARLTERPDVTCWAYTRSWRVPYLLPHLEELRAMPNMQLFASMDVSAEDMPPTGWRIAWIDGDPRAGFVHGTVAHLDDQSILPWEVQRTASGTKALICPEETKDVVNCESCGFCFDGKRNDVIFLKH